MNTTDETKSPALSGGKKRGHFYMKHSLVNCARGSRRNPEGGCSPSPCGKKSPYCGRFRERTSNLVDHVSHPNGLRPTEVVRARMRGQLSGRSPSVAPSGSASGSRSGSRSKSHESLAGHKIYRLAEKEGRKPAGTRYIMHLGKRTYFDKWPAALKKASKR